MATIQDYSDLLQQKKAFAHLATLMPDGTPQVTPVWVDYRDGRVLNPLASTNLALDGTATIDRLPVYGPVVNDGTYSLVDLTGGNATVELDLPASALVGRSAQKRSVSGVCTGPSASVSAELSQRSCADHVVLRQAATGLLIHAT